MVSCFGGFCLLFSLDAMFLTMPSCTEGMLNELFSFLIGLIKVTLLLSFRGDIPASSASALYCLNLIVASKLAASPKAAFAIDENLLLSSSGFFLTGNLI
jgi:hypothetical protein